MTSFISRTPSYELKIPHLLKTDSLIFSVPHVDLDGVYSAREFVNWYNGHPYYADETRESSVHEKIKTRFGN